jgi:uncharacterized membrane protein
VLSRAWNAVIAVLVVVFFVLQLVVAAQVAGSPAGHAVGSLAGASLAGRLLRVISFFTIQSNLLSAIVAIQLVANPRRDGAAWRAVRLAALFGITVTGIVYSTVLARVHEPHGWKEVSTNTVFHYIVPIMMVVGWMCFGPRPRITGRVIAWALAWPILYFGYILVLGAASGWYPYPFLNVAGQGYGRVLVNAVLVTMVFGAVGGLYGWGDRKLRPTAAATG